MPKLQEHEVALAHLKHDLHEMRARARQLEEAGNTAAALEQEDRADNILHTIEILLELKISPRHRH
jgi:hypothetical protein